MTNGFAGRSFRSSYIPTNLPMSSRENPNAVCVRSFVPKEKKSADAAMSAAVSSPREGARSSCPTRRATAPYRRARPERRAPAPRASVGARVRSRPGSSPRPSGRALPHAPPRRPRRRADLHRVQAGLHDPQAHAAEPQHRVGLVQLVHLLQQAFLVRDVLATRLRERHLDREVDLVGQELVERRSSSRTVTGSPSIARKIPRKSSRWSGASSSRSPPPPPRSRRRSSCGPSSHAPRPGT